MPTLGVIAPVTADPYADAELAALSDLVRSRQVGAVWVRDLPVVPAGDPDRGQGHDPFAFLALLSGTGVGVPVVGTASVILGVRHPLVVARAALGGARHSGGRFVLGLGTGGKPAMNAALGVDRDQRARLWQDWFAIRTALRGQAGAGLDFLRPAGVEPPPMYLASSNTESWAAVGGEVEGWMAFLTSEQEFLAERERIQRICGHPVAVAVRMDLRLLPDDAPTPPAGQDPVRGRLDLRCRDAGRLLRRWRDLPVDHLLVRMRGPRPLEDLGRVLAAAAR